MRILFAYCVELGGVVSIDTARKYFTCEDPKKERYNFTCSDPNCINDHVRISGVNYKTLATENIKLKAAHFRELDMHKDGCVWGASEGVPKLWLPNEYHETDEEIRQRFLRQKLSDLVNVFDPSLNNRSGNVMKTSLYESIEVDLDKNIANIKNRISGKIGEIVTNNLERLVETFREAKTILPPEDFNELTIRIVGGGIVKLSQYFKRITQVALGENYCVIYGGAYFKGRYGNGFKFVFFDKIENKSISLYISPEIMEKYRFSFRRYIEEYLAQSELVKYYTIYAIGKLLQSHKFNVINLVLEDLRHLVFVLGPKKIEAPSISANDTTK